MMKSLCSLSTSVLIGICCIYSFTYATRPSPRRNAVYRSHRGPLFESLFWDAGLNDAHFHQCVKAELSKAMLSVSASRAFVMGVEYGADVLDLARQGYEVTGVEPIPEYCQSLIEHAAEAGVLNKVNIYLAAVGSERGITEISYNNASVRTPVVRLDDIVKNGEPVDILSIDVHGSANNYDVLLGGAKALKNGMFKSIWVELFPSGDWGVKMLNMLRSMDYVLFDFKWFGGSMSCSKRKIPAYECADLKTYEGLKPQGTSEEYMKTMKQALDAEFQYLQTDIIAIHKNEVTRMKHALNEAARFCQAAL